MLDDVARLRVALRDAALNWFDLNSARIAAAHDGVEDASAD